MLTNRYKRNDQVLTTNNTPQQIAYRSLNKEQAKTFLDVLLNRMLHFQAKAHKAA